MLCLASPALAERRLLSPSVEQPARVAPGSTLSLVVEVATALSPPPGIQEERAHRAFAVTLCAEGLPLAAPARVCFPLAVRNLRPLDGNSLRYRVEAPVPLWVAPSTYDLAVRFPGGEARLTQGVRVARSERDLPLPAPVRAASDGYQLEAGARPALVRVHVGAAGLSLEGASYEAFPLPGEAGLRLGFVALISLGAGQRASVSAAPRAARRPLSIATGAGSAADQVQLTALPVPPGGRVFWWLGPESRCRGQLAAGEARRAAEGARAGNVGRPDRACYAGRAADSAAAEACVWLRAHPPRGASRARLGVALGGRGFARSRRIEETRPRHAPPAAPRTAQPRE